MTWRVSALPREDVYFFQATGIEQVPLAADGRESYTYRSHLESRSAVYVLVSAEDYARLEQDDRVHVVVYPITGGQRAEIEGDDLLNQYRARLFLEPCP